MSAINSASIIRVSPNWRKVLENKFAKLKFVAPLAKLAIDSASLALNYTGSLGLNLLDPVSCRGLFALFALSFDIVSPEASRHRRLTFRFAPGRHARIQQTFIVICGVDRWTDGRRLFFPGSTPG